MPIDDALKEIAEKEEKEKIAAEKEANEKRKLELLEIQKKLNEKIDSYKIDLGKVSSDKQDDIIRAHLRALSNYWPEKNPTNKVDKAVIKLVTLPNFIEIYRNTLILTDYTRRFEYILMKGLEGKAFNTLIDDEKLFVKLAPLGINLICPYYEYAENKKSLRVVYDKCLIDGEETDTLCRGKHYQCEIFTDRTGKFVTGELNYMQPKKTYTPPKIILSEEEREQIEMKLTDEIEKYWRDDD